jgi:Flp pilus assembly protein TadD
MCEVWSSIGKKPLSQGKLTEAEGVHLEAIRLKPKQSKRYDAYADFLSDVGRNEEANAMYRQAEKLRFVN